MSKIYANPFNWGQPVSGNNYIARPEQQDSIHASIENQTHLIIYGNRGTGKTSLVKQVLEKSSVNHVYLDLRFVVSREGLIDSLLNELEQNFPAPKVNGPLKEMRARGEALSLGAIFELWYELLKQGNQKISMAWDEFQHLVKLKEDIIAELRNSLGHKRGITHLFISHREDVLREVFEDSRTPFFTQSEFLGIGNIDLAPFSRFLSTRFRRMGLSDFDLPTTVLKFTEGQPQLTQEFAHALAQLWLEGNTTRLMDRTLVKMLNEYNLQFTTLWDTFGLNEKRLLLGLASGYSRPTELGFISKFKLSATSTAHNTVVKLLREGWLVNRDEGYHLYDPLFLKWLQQSQDSP